MLWYHVSTAGLELHKTTHIEYSLKDYWHFSYREQANGFGYDNPSGAYRLCVQRSRLRPGINKAMHQCSDLLCKRPVMCIP